MIEVDWKNLRVWIGDRRLHHGLFGCFLIGFGAVLAYHDRHDFPWVAD